MPRLTHLAIDQVMMRGLVVTVARMLSQQGPGSVKVSLTPTYKECPNYAIQGNIFAIQRECALRNEPITAEEVRSKILHMNEEKQHTLVEVYKYHNDQFQKLAGVEFSNGTFKKFKSALKSPESLIKRKFNKNDVHLAAVNNKFITDYEFYLKSIQKLQHNSPMGNIAKLKKIIRQCVANDRLDKDPFKAYKITNQGAVRT